jgi:hypothetical protein
MALEYRPYTKKENLFNPNHESPGESFIQAILVKSLLR